MISFKCSNCGGEMTISHAGELMCPYCGTKHNFSDKELEGYKVFRHRMLEYLAAVAEKRAKASDFDYLWTNSAEILFKTIGDEDITVNYIYEYTDGGITSYVARESVVILFPKEHAHLADVARSGALNVTAPKADMKNLLQYVPTTKGIFKLQDGGVLWVISKDEGMFPLGLFGNLDYQDVAWIVSRLENLACLFEFSGIVHGNISPDTVYINPATHEAAILGGWWKSYGTGSARTTDLKEIRDTAHKLIGNAFPGIPKMFKEFISGPSKADAFADFEYWDEVIEKGLGGRHFHKFGK